MSCANSVQGQTTERALYAPLLYDLCSRRVDMPKHTAGSRPFSSLVVPAREHEELQNYLQWWGLRIDDRHSFDCGNLAEDLVGGYKVFDGAGAVQAQGDGELERIERAQAQPAHRSLQPRHRSRGHRASDACGLAGRLAAGDGAAAQRTGGTGERERGVVESEFALEYERTPKAKRRYELVRYRVEHEEQLRRFVYIAANYHLMNYVARMFTGTRRPVYFGLLTDILHRQLDMDVLDASRTRRQPLRDVLLR